MSGIFIDDEALQLTKNVINIMVSCTIAIDSLW